MPGYSIKLFQGRRVTRIYTSVRIIGSDGPMRRMDILGITPELLPPVETLRPYASLTFVVPLPLERINACFWYSDSGICFKIGR